MLEHQFSQFSEIHLQYPIVYKVYFSFSYLLAVYICTTVCDRDRGAGGWQEGHAPSHFSLQMQFLTAFLDHRVTIIPANLPELQLKFDNQIAGNRTFKVPVFKIS